jgi:thymidylate kinase
MFKEHKAFIVFTGIDGSGKTLHAKLLSQELQKRGLSSVYFRPRDLSLVPNFIKKLLEKHPNLSPRNITMAKEYSKFNGRDILKAILLTVPFLLYSLIVYYLWIYRLRRKYIVVCDRYFFDWFYNLWGNNSSILVRLLPQPNAVFLLDISPGIALSRMHDVFDKKVPLAYYEALRNWFLELGKELGFLTIDSSRKLEEVKSLILSHTANLLENEEVA